MAAMMAMMAKFVSVATALITVPITLHYLGVERYGMWMILSSMVAMLSFADLGIGNGILNAVAAAYGRDDQTAIRCAVSSGAAALGGIALLVMVGVVLTYPYVAWHALFNVRSGLARAEAGPAIAAFAACFALSIPANMVQRVQMGMQRSFMASAWLCAGSIFTLPAVLTAVHLQAGLPVLVAVLMGMPVLASIANTIWFFGLIEPNLRPSLRHANRREVRGAAQSGVFFLMIQLGNSATANCVPVIIAHVIGPAAVATYAVPERLLSLVVMLASMYVQPLWPAYREALMRGDVDWIRHTYLRTIVRVALGAGLLLTLLGGAMPIILSFWVGSMVRSSMSLILGLCFYKLLESMLWVNANLLNGLNVIASQAAIATVTAVTFIGVVYGACHFYGVVAIPWAAASIIGLVTLAPGALIISRHLAGLNQGSVKA